MTIRTLLIDNYDSYTYNLFQLIAEVNGGERSPLPALLPGLACVLPRRHAEEANAAAGMHPPPPPAELPTVLRNDELDWSSLRRRLEAGEFHNVVISPGPGTPQRAADVGACRCPVGPAPRCGAVGATRNNAATASCCWARGSLQLAVQRPPTSPRLLPALPQASPCSCCKRGCPSPH